MSQTNLPNPQEVPAVALSAEQIEKVEAETRDEIDEIMNEIEELRKDPEPEPASDEVGHDLMEGAGEGGGSLEETLGDLKGEETDAPSLLDVTESNSQTVSAEAVQEKPMSMSTNDRSGSDSDSGSLSLVLTGNMTLKLKYEYEGQEITVGFADQAMHIALADGTEFKIPLGGRKLRSVA